MQLSREEKRALKAANRALEERTWTLADALLAPLRVAGAIGSILLSWARPKRKRSTLEVDDE